MMCVRLVISRSHQISFSVRIHFKQNNTQCVDIHSVSLLFCWLQIAYNTTIPSHNSFRAKSNFRAIYCLILLYFVLLLVNDTISMRLNQRRRSGSTKLITWCVIDRFTLSLSFFASGSHFSVLLAEKMFLVRRQKWISLAQWMSAKLGSFWLSIFDELDKLPLVCLFY